MQRLLPADVQCPADVLAVTTCRAGLAAVYAPSKDKIRQKMEDAKNKSSWESWLNDKPSDQEETVLRYENGEALLNDLKVTNDLVVTKSFTDESIEGWRVALVDGQVVTQRQDLWMASKAAESSNVLVEEKFPKENFRVNGEMQDEILVYESILSNFWAKIASKCRENCVKI